MPNIKMYILSSNINHNDALASLEELTSNTNNPLTAAL